MVSNNDKGVDTCWKVGSPRIYFSLRYFGSCKNNWIKAMKHLSIVQSLVGGFCKTRLALGNHRGIHVVVGRVTKNSSVKREP
jgi:hypothetical protein